MPDLGILKQGKIWCYRGKVIVTDFPQEKRNDAVFPLCHENCYFVDHLVPENGSVLDLCTGSGVIAIFATEKAKQVVATDINPRSLEFARLNAALNGVEQKIDFRHGDLFEPVNGMKFDAILVNPPFEPSNLRPSSKLLHSDGGVDGAKVVRRVINGLQDHLTIGASFQMIIGILKDCLGTLESLQDGWFSKVTINELDVWNTDIQYLFIEARNFKGRDKK